MKKKSVSGSIVCFSMYDVLAYINKISEILATLGREHDTPICASQREQRQKQCEKILRKGKKKTTRSFPNVTQELEIEAFTCTVLRCVNKSSFAETSRGFYYCSTL